jgi:hypothetical protein
MRIEAQIGPKVVRHLAHQTGKWRLAEQEIGGLLVLPARSSTFQYEGARGIKAGYLISHSATVYGLYLCTLLTPPVAGALLCAALATGAFFGARAARPPVDL